MSKPGLRCLVLSKAFHLYAGSFPQPGCRCCPVLLLQKKNTGDVAQGTTEEEFKDNLYHIVHRFQQKTAGTPPILCYDNNKIQAIADISELRFDNKPVIHVDVAQQKVDLPTYSPDMNRPIEHLFGFIKARVRAQLYKDYAKYIDPKALQAMVFKVFNEQLVKGAVERDVAGLPLLWHIISTPLGSEHTDAEGDIHPGTGGDYPNSQYR